MKTLTKQELYKNIGKHFIYSFLLAGGIASVLPLRLALASEMSGDFFTNLNTFLMNDETRRGVIKIFCFSTALLSPFLVFSIWGTILSFKKERIEVSSNSVTIFYLKNRSILQRTLDLAEVKLEKNNILSLRPTYLISFRDESDEITKVPVSPSIATLFDKTIK